MNVETGQVYQGEEEIRKARERGEPIREMTPEEIREYKARVRDRYEKSMFGPQAYKDRSGSKPIFRRDKVRAKNKAARKARKRN